MTKETLEKINKFTRKNLAENDVYTFDVVLCDNEVDRDGERFSLSSLKSLKDLFIGKTGIFDHDKSASNQTARIFDTALETDKAKKTQAGEEYTSLKASVYMIKTKENENLIKEIDGGIKKEVSVSCRAEIRKCSVCGSNINKKMCQHIKNKSGHIILDKITDAYEWSFVAVPAQVNAGVTRKHFIMERKEENNMDYEEILEENEKMKKALKEEITKLLFIKGETGMTKIIQKSADKMTGAELLDLKSELQNNNIRKNKPILEIYDKSVGCFKMEDNAK